jgi:hypothetical protein
MQNRNNVNCLWQGGLDLSGLSDMGKVFVVFLEFGASAIRGI